MVRSFLPKFSSRSERRLLALCKNNPDENPDTKKWNKNAVQYLVKKLKKNLDIIDELEKAISQECSNTKCVPVPKTADNRLLVSHRRGLPQVIYCRLWRWPDLQSHHQIRAISTCESSVEPTSGLELPSRSQTVCVNPYHYERKKPASLEPVLVPCSRIPPDLSTSFEDSDPTGGTKAIPNRIRQATVTGATVLSLLSPAPPLIVSSNSESIISAPEVIPTTTSQALSGQASTTITMGEQPGNNDQNLPQQVPAYEEVFMSYEREQQYIQQQQAAALDEETLNFLQEIMPADPTQQQYEQPIINEAQPQLFLPDQQQSQTQIMHPQQQQQPHVQHQHIHQQQQTPIQHHQQPIQQQQPQQQQQQQPQQLPLQHQTHIQQPHQRMQGLHQQHMQQQQHMPQTHQQQQMPQQQMQQTHQHQQYQQQYRPMHQHPPQTAQPGTLVQTINTQTEIAHPFQFKQNKFAHLARAMHEHNVASQQPAYDSHGYATRSYTYVPQPQPQQQAQVQYSQQYQPQSQPDAPSTYTQLGQYPTNPPPSYATIYPQQQQSQQYTQQEQMQLDYQQEVPMVVGPQQSTYYEPVAGPSHSNVDQSQPIPVIDFQEIPYTEGTCWCSISYHEYDQRVGEKYQPNSLTVCVDGYTHPMCSNRFCIGGLSNVNRNEFTEWVRRRIGKGVKFTYVDGEVYVECLCDSSVFVSSPMLGVEEGKDYQERVSKVTHGSSIRVFSNPQFSKLLSSAVSKGFEAVYKLTNYCTFRVSFVKGWGRNYKRQTILNTPCWVEVQLNGPLQWIDKVLRQMRPPQGCGSTS